VPLDPVEPSLTAYPAFDSLEAEAVVVAVAASVEEVVVGGGLDINLSWNFQVDIFTSKTIPNPPPSNAGFIERSKVG
jgi:hypothetical protein